MRQTAVPVADRIGDSPEVSVCVASASRRRCVDGVPAHPDPDTEGEDDHSGRAYSELQTATSGVRDIRVSIPAQRTEIVGERLHRR